jgi:hypothetical protein
MKTKLLLVGILLASNALWGFAYLRIAHRIAFDEAWILAAQHVGLTRRQLHGISVVAYEANR